MPEVLYHLSPGKTTPGRCSLMFGMYQSYDMSSCSIRVRSGRTPSQNCLYLYAKVINYKHLNCVGLYTVQNKKREISCTSNIAPHIKYQAHEVEVYTYEPDCNEPLTFCSRVRLADLWLIYLRVVEGRSPLVSMRAFRGKELITTSAKSLTTVSEPWLHRG